MLFGKSPATTGVLLVAVTGVGVCQIVATGATMVNGCPEVQLKIAPNIQRSVKCCTSPGELARNFRFGPNGSSKVPLLITLCVRWKFKRALSNARLLGSRGLYTPSPTLPFAMKARVFV